MTAFDSTGMEREPFIGSATPIRPSRTRRPLPGHRPACSSDPEIGCTCGRAERESERSEIGADQFARMHRTAMRRYPDCGDCAAGKGTIHAGVGHSAVNPAHGHCACRACALRMAA